MSTGFDIANKALGYVRDQMMVKAANREADAITAEMFDAAETTKIPSEDLVVAAGIEDDGMIDCLAWARVAQSSRIANCLGMASLAFAWVAFKHAASRPVGVYGFKGSTGDPDGGSSTIVRRTMAITGKPLDMSSSYGRVSIANGVRTRTDVFDADHAICIIGDPKLDRDGNVTIHGAYVCDPWARRVYDAATLADESALIAKVTGGSTRLTCLALLAAGQTLPPDVRGVIGIAE